MKSRRLSFGFTIVEMLLYMGILSGFLLVVSQIFLSALDVQRESEATTSVEEDGRYILSRFQYDITRAQKVTVPTTLGSQSNTLQLTIGNGSSIYAVNGTNLTLTDAIGTSTLNSYGSSVSAFGVQRLGNIGGKESVKLGFTLTSSTQRPAGPEVRTFQTTVGIR